MRQIVEFLAAGEPMKALDLFERTVDEGHDDDSTILEASRLLANYIRHSSRFKRHLIFLKLQKCSALSRLYLSFQFNSFRDSAFPKKEIFEGSSLHDSEAYLERTPTQRHYVTSVGSNRFFNLGLLSDGSPVAEPHLVQLPARVRQIEMSNSHTIFLTDPSPENPENRLFGCGKAASFLPESSVSNEHHKTGGYVALPVAIRSQNGCRVEQCHVAEGKTMYRVGERWISGSGSSVELKLTNYSTLHLNCEGKCVKIFLRIQDRRIFWNRTADFEAQKPVEFIVNGFTDAYFFDGFQILADGTIYVANNGLLKGRLELWKNKDDGFQVDRKTVSEHFDTKYTLVGILDEIPGSCGTDFFKLSPDGQNLIMKKGKEITPPVDAPRTVFESIQHHKIIKNRSDQYDPIDIAMDLTVIFKNDDNEPVFVDYEEEYEDDESPKFETNRFLFESMFPEHVEQIQGDEIVFDVEENPNSDLFVNWERPISTEFVPENTPLASIFHLISTEKQRIPCHKSLILVHSRQIAAMQRFNTNYGNFGMEIADFGDEKEQEIREIEMNATAEVIRNAIGGIRDIRTLYGIKTIELIECIHFYDYHLMEEMFRDAWKILGDTVTEHTVSFLYEMYSMYEDQVVEALAKRPHLVYTSISGIVPPRGLLKRLSKNLPQRIHHQKPHPSAPSDPSKWSLATCETEYVIKNLVNLDDDWEEFIWSALREKCDDELATWHAEAARRREERRGAVRSRTTSHKRNSRTLIEALTSSPIPIGGRPKTDSFSKSLASPSAQSPLASMSMSPKGGVPIGKPRNDSISNSLDDFPEMGFISPSTPKSTSSARFAPKGARFKKDLDILKPLAPVNPWKTSATTSSGPSPAIWEQEERVNFDEVIRKEEKLQKNIKSGFKKVRLLPHVELEELARAEILQIFAQELHDEALIKVELVDEDFGVENEEIVWGHMPGLVRR
ncbi:hypothetical protein L5515_000195 [Caenorhabditis briggsae]|uniref:Uncharacterized protein n=1 Tax=Caenorhabditis briggsae TaxID=6238 RepID=A0AAE9DZT4_CAEBR|nr:hypothetical protein L5515_000195 [Caenorhabditis briggsae]